MCTVNLSAPVSALSIVPTEATTEALDEEGFLYSGDVGHVDEDGFLFITDRKKDIIITAGGENITPSLMEVELKKSAIIADAVVIGDHRPYLTVLVSLDPEAVAEAWPRGR